MKRLSLVIIVLTILVSCKNTEDNSNNNEQVTVTVHKKEPINEDEIKAVANKFLEFLHGKINFKEIKKMYVDLPYFSIWGIDNHTVDSIQEVGEEVLVTATINSRDPEEDDNSSTLLLKFIKIDGEWKIINSKGLGTFRANEMAYAIENNFIDENDNLWDVETLIAIKKSKNKK